jgi:hypothetical protein
MAHPQPGSACDGCAELTLDGAPAGQICENDWAWVPP